MKILAVCALVLVAAAVFAVRSYAGDSAAMPKAGDPAPVFTLPSQEGAEISLASYRGKWVVLYFYPKDMTSGCTIEAHNFQRDLKLYEQANAVILGVSLDSADSHKQFCTKEGLSFRLLADTDHKVTDAYGDLASMGVIKLAKRSTFLIDPQGKIAKVWTGVDPKVHSEEVLAELARHK